MRTVALVGFADTTRHYAYHLPPDVELWTLNRLWCLEENFTRIDRLFEMHTYEYLADPKCFDTQESRRLGEKAHIDWMREHHPFPVYAVKAHPQFPASVAYPFQAVNEDVFCHIWRDVEHVRLFASTFDYMIALAIHEKVDRILIYGFEMATSTEYAYQRDSGMILIGVAGGRGIDVVIPEESQLIPKLKLYGYECGQMITRQTLESYLRTAEIQRDQYKALANARIGILQHLAKNGASPQEIEKAQTEHFKAMRMLDKWDGVQQILKMLIAECDLQEVDPSQVIQAVPIATPDFGGNHGNSY